MYRRALLLSLFAFAVSMTYAITRYVVFGQHPATDIPLFILNKAAAVSSVIMLLFAVTERKRPDAPPLFYAFYLLMIVHVFLSFQITTAAYFPAFFVNGKFTLQYAFMWLAGLLAFLHFLGFGVIKIFQPASGAHEQLLTYLSLSGMILFLVHVLLRGLPAWFTPQQWPGGMLPLSFIAFILGVIALYIMTKRINNEK